uniref:Putative secreted protein n=1 Tax=Anopheles marajoara TaxID=58244 RepID=A0A2M4CA64_9DIPT
MNLARVSTRPSTSVGLSIPLICMCQLRVAASFSIRFPSSVYSLRYSSSTVSQSSTSIPKYSSSSSRVQHSSSLSRLNTGTASSFSSRRL